MGPMNADESADYVKAYQDMEDLAKPLKIDKKVELTCQQLENTFPAALDDCVEIYKQLLYAIEAMEFMSRHLKNDRYRSCSVIRLNIWNGQLLNQPQSIKITYM